jgi:hypothetical protein
MKAIHFLLAVIVAAIDAYDRKTAQGEYAHED